MAHEPLALVLRRLRRWVGGGPGGDQSDGHLLERFAATHDEAAFASLMQRHGPLVLSVCRRLLTDPHDIDDAFQATFVVLVRRAAALKQEGSLGSWLYTVAYRIALKARAQGARRRVRENQADDMTLNAAAASDRDPQDRARQRELREVLDAEVHRLPEKYRAPLILCYLEGKTNEQAAQELGCPVGSMSWRLDKGRELLRSRLAGRGISLSSVALGAALTENAASAAVPMLLGESTLRIAGGLMAGRAAAGLMSANVAHLADGFLHTVWLGQLRTAALVVVALALGSGASVFAYRAWTDRPNGSAGEADVADYVERRVAELQPTPEERKIDRIGWARDIRDGVRLSKESGRPVFLFTHTGRIGTGRCGGSAFNMRANSLNDDRVIALLNKHFVPVYANVDDMEGAGQASAAEKAEYFRIYHGSFQAKLDVGSDVVYILNPAGQPVATIGMRLARKPNELVARLEELVRQTGAPSGEPVVAPTAQSTPPAPAPDTLVLHLVARIGHRQPWGEFPAENWIVLSPDDCRRFARPGPLTAGASWDVDPELVVRLLTYFYPQTENNDLKTNRIDQYFLSARVASVQDGVARLHLAGSLRMKHPFYSTRPDDNFVDATLLGLLDFDLTAGRVRSLKLATEKAAYGKHDFAAVLRSLP